MGAFEDGVENSADRVRDSLRVINSGECRDDAPEVEQQMDEVPARLAIAVDTSPELGDVQLMPGNAPARVPKDPGRPGDIGLSGTAIDYLIRAALADGALGCTVATCGAQRIDARDPSVGVRLEREAVAMIDDLAPWKDGLDAEELREVCRMCLVLACFDQFFRAGLQVWTYVGEPLLDRPSLDDYAERVVPPACLLDLETIAGAAIEDHRDLRASEPLLLNPNFDLSQALGGADGDLIAGDTLWDFKSSAGDTSVFGRDDLWQLIGYALADQSDTYEVASLGIAASRRRRRVCWSLPELLAELSSERRPLAQRRAGFAEAVSLANTVARSRVSKPSPRAS